MARYRDTKTGKFISKATWTRSKAQGGTRYKRTVTRITPVAVTSRRKPSLPKTSPTKRPAPKPKQLRDSKGRFLPKPKPAPKPAPKKKRAPKKEFVIRADYGTRKKNNQIELQVHIFAPANATDQQIIAAAIASQKNEPMPKGFQVKKIKYSHGKGSAIMRENDQLPVIPALESQPEVERDEFNAEEFDMSGN